MKRLNDRLRYGWFTLRSLLLFGVLYLLFALVGGAACWVGWCLLKHQMTRGYLPHSMPSIIIIVLLGGGIFLICTMIGSLSAVRKINRPDLKKIDRAEFPALFDLIDETAVGMGAKPPKHVYLSAKASASVFLNTGLWSALFPTKKNLEIGLGLIGFLNQEELKAVLAHEFDHFSHRSLRLNGPVYALGQSMQYVLQKIRIKKRGVIEEQFYGFVYLFRSLSELLFARLSRHFAHFSVELEYEADRKAAQYAGRGALISALRKASLAAHTFDITVESLAVLADAGKGITDIYAAQRIVHEEILVQDVPMSSLTLKRLEKLTVEQTDTSELGVPETELLPDYTSECQQMTAKVYHEPLKTDLSTLAFCPLNTYRQWIRNAISEQNAVRSESTKVKIRMEKNLHRVPWTDLLFDVYWDGVNLGKGRCRKGFVLLVETAPGSHLLSFEGQYVNPSSQSIEIGSAPKYTIHLDYALFLRKTEYRFSIKKIEVSE
ncbi:MAG: M48 family metallopeptidase [Culturomica sp.]|jgi:Zn-dependent protease with chaperone function|nr:M48 family metallopeptidase [Culturomica sp.]